LKPLARPAVQRFVGIAARFDEIVARYGFQEGMRQIVSNFASDIFPMGRENVPEEGPLLLVANHPGTCDSLAIAASLPRDDLKIIASGFPLLRELPNASRNLIFTDPKAKRSENFSVVRSVIRHLKTGGSILIFPSGKIEPDPAVLPGAVEALNAWSPSIELFLRKVPETKVEIIIVSGVLAPVFLHNPFIKLSRGATNPQTVAEAVQIITQMLLKRWVRIRPNISFGLPKTVDDLLHESESLYHSLIAEASQMLNDHIKDLQSLV